MAPAEKDHGCERGNPDVTSHPYHRPVNKIEHSHAIPGVALLEPSFSSTGGLSPCFRAPPPLLSSTRSRVVLPRRPRRGAAARRRLSGIGLTRRSGDGAKLGTPIGTPDPLQCFRSTAVLPDEMIQQARGISCAVLGVRRRSTTSSTHAKGVDVPESLAYLCATPVTGRAWSRLSSECGDQLLRTGSRKTAYFPPSFP